MTVVRWPQVGELVRFVTSMSDGEVTVEAVSDLGLADNSCEMQVARMSAQVQTEALREVVKLAGQHGRTLFVDSNGQWGVSP